MLDKLEIGMYVRTYEGYIAKFINKEIAYQYRGLNMTEDNKRYYYIYCFDGAMNEDWSKRFTESEIEEFDIFPSDKPSFNIIDLIKPGDYVELTSEHCKDEIYKVTHSCDGSIILDCHGDGYIVINSDKKIKSILTKERYEKETYSIR